MELGPGAWSDEGYALAGVSGDPLLVGSGSLASGSGAVAYAGMRASGGRGPVGQLAISVYDPSRPLTSNISTEPPATIGALSFVTSPVFSSTA